MKRNVDREFTALVPTKQNDTSLLPGRKVIKRKFRNKEVEAVFDPEDFREYLTGFSKRKQQRREYAQKKITELEKKAIRKTRIQRNNKLKKSLGIPEGGCWVSASDAEDQDTEQEKNGMITYSSGDVTTTVVTTKNLKLNSDVESSNEEDEKNDNEVGPRLTGTQPMSGKSLPFTTYENGCKIPKKKKMVNPKRACKGGRVKGKKGKRKSIKG